MGTAAKAGRWMLGPSRILFVACPRQSAPLSCLCAVREACSLRILFPKNSRRVQESKIERHREFEHVVEQTRSRMVLQANICHGCVNCHRSVGLSDPESPTPTCMSDSFLSALCERSSLTRHFPQFGADAVHVARRHEAALRLQDVLRQTMYVERRGQRFRQAVGTGN